MPYSLQFQSTLPAGEATKAMVLEDNAGLFQSTLPAGEATQCPRKAEWKPAISIHASRGGSDIRETSGEAFFTFISIHASRGGSDLIDSSIEGEAYISIHASRGGSDI